MAPVARYGHLLEKRKIWDFLRMALLPDMLKQAHYNTWSFIFRSVSCTININSFVHLENLEHYEKLNLYGTIVPNLVFLPEIRGEIWDFMGQDEWNGKQHTTAFPSLMSLNSWTYRENANKQHIKAQEDLDLLSQNMDAQSISSSFFKLFPMNLFHFIKNKHGGQKLNVFHFIKI